MLLVAGGEVQGQEDVLHVLEHVFDADLGVLDLLDDGLQQLAAHDVESRVVALDAHILGAQVAHNDLEDHSEVGGVAAPLHPTNGLHLVPALEDLVVGQDVHCQGLQGELEELLLRLLYDRVQVTDAVYCLLRLWGYCVDVLSLYGSVPASRRLQDDLQQGVHRPVEIGEAVIYPYLGVILHQRIAIV